MRFIESLSRMRVLHGGLIIGVAMLMTAESASAEFVTIKPARRPDLALGVPAQSARVQGAAVTFVPAQAGDLSQHWIYTNGYGAAALVNRASGKCLDIENRSPGDHARIIQWTCYPTKSQDWFEKRMLGGAFFLRSSLNTDKCVDIATFPFSAGVRLETYGCGSVTSTKQHFRQYVVG